MEIHKRLNSVSWLRQIFSPEKPAQRERESFQLGLQATGAENDVMFQTSRLSPFVVRKSILLLLLNFHIART